jgi:predicted ribosome quality control (RQC) complex YloA/Tae2 family protein
MKIDTFEGFRYKIGKNSRENDILCKQSEPDDVWMHVSGISVAHCVIENTVQVPAMDITCIPEHVIRHCAMEMKAMNKKLAPLTKVAFSVTLVRYLITTKISGLVVLNPFKITNIIVR